MRTDHHGVPAHRTPERDRLLDRAELGFEQTLHRREIVHRQRHAPAAHRTRDTRQSVAAIEQQAALIGVRRIRRGIVEMKSSAPFSWRDVDAVRRPHRVPIGARPAMRGFDSLRRRARALGARLRQDLREDSATTPTNTELRRFVASRSFSFFLRTESTNRKHPAVERDHAA